MSLHDRLRHSTDPADPTAAPTAAPAAAPTAVRTVRAGRRPLLRRPLLRHPLLRRMRDGDEDGFTLIEMMAALVVLSIGLLGMLDELVNYMQSETNQRAQSAAVQLAATATDGARSLPYASLASLVGAPQTTTTSASGVTYTETTSLVTCSILSASNNCLTASTGTPTAVRVAVSLSWQTNGHPHQLNVATAVTNATSTLFSGTGNGVLGNLVGGTSTSSSGLSVTLGALTVSPTTVSVNAAGTPTAPITVSLSAVGLTSATTIPLTWTDDNGGHQVTMTMTGTNVWSATIPAASITRVASGTTPSTISFAATAPGGTAVPTATLNLVAQPAFSGTCTISPNPIVQKLLSTQISSPLTLSCTTTGLASTDTVTATYNNGSGTAVTTPLTSSTGSTWSVVLPTGTTVSVLTDTFTFALTRSSDGSTGTPQSQTVVVT